MTVRLLLVAPAASEALRDARFDDDSPLEPAGLSRATDAVGTLPPAVHTYVSPSLRCRQTAHALGLNAEPLPAIAACDMGRWRGQTLDSLAVTEEHAVTQWLGDPGAAPHGGESLRDVRVRIGAWLDGLHSRTGRIVAVAEPDAVRMAVVHALAAPDDTFWRLDIPPFTVTELSGRAARWNLRNGRALEPRTTDPGRH